VDNDVHQLIAELATVVRASGNDLHGLRQASRTIAADDTSLQAYLRAVTLDDALAAQIAAASFWHPSGFARLVLHAHGQPEFYVRLHVWPDGCPDRPIFDVSQIHGHRWAYASLVLVGGIHAEYFEERPDFDLDDEKILLCRRYGNGQATGAECGPLLAEGAAPLLSVGGNTYGWPESHGGEPDDLHLVMPFDGEFTATLFLHGPYLKHTVPVYQPLGRDAPGGRSHPIETTEVQRIAELTLDHIAERE
jgi:hypothetical protein